MTIEQMAYSNTLFDVLYPISLEGEPMDELATLQRSGETIPPELADMVINSQ